MSSDTLLDYDKENSDSMNLSSRSEKDNKKSSESLKQRNKRYVKKKGDTTRKGSGEIDKLSKQLRNFVINDENETKDEVQKIHEKFIDTEKKANADCNDFEIRETVKNENEEACNNFPIELPKSEFSVRKEHTEDKKPSEEDKEKTGKVEEIEKNRQGTKKNVKNEEQEIKKRQTARLTKAVAKFSKEFTKAAGQLGIIEQSEETSSDSSFHSSSYCSSSCTCSDCCTTTCDSSCSCCSSDQSEGSCSTCISSSLSTSSSSKASDGDTSSASTY